MIQFGFYLLIDTGYSGSYPSNHGQVLVYSSVADSGCYFFGTLDPDCEVTIQNPDPKHYQSVILFSQVYYYHKYMIVSFRSQNENNYDEISYFQCWIRIVIFIITIRNTSLQDAGYRVSQGKSYSMCTVDFWKWQ